MDNNSSVFDTHEDLLVQPYRGGIQLVKPDRYNDAAHSSLASLYQLPIGVCFADQHHHVKGGNEIIVEMINAVSVQDMMDTTCDHYWKHDFAERLKSHERRVHETKSMIIVEETGLGQDGVNTLQGLSFKYPWYYDDKLIGIFNYTLSIDPTSLGSFSQTLAQIMTTGLLGANPYIPAINPHPEANLTQRENEVLKLLQKGHTAKSIAMTLKLSHRTIEHHIENIRLKTNCHSKIELIQKYSD